MKYPLIVKNPHNPISEAISICVSRNNGSLSRSPTNAYECDTITNSAHSKCNMSKLLFLNVS